MGYRSTLITDHWDFKFPDWFVEKYKERYNFGKNNSLPLSSKTEVRRFWDNAEEDIVKCLLEQKSDWRILAIWLHGDGKITRIVFDKNGTHDFEESEWND